MSWKAESSKIYEERSVNDSLVRLAERLDLKGLPLSEKELKSLARRSREERRPIRRWSQPPNRHGGWALALLRSSAAAHRDR